MTGTTTRRFFLASMAAGAAVLRSQSSTAGPKATFPIEPAERLAVSTYPFRSFIRGGKHSADSEKGAKLTLAQFAAELPGKLHVSHIEPWSPHFESTETAYVASLHDAFEKAGVKVVDIPVDAPVLFCSADTKRRDANLDLYRRWIDIAVTLQSPSIRLHMPPVKNESSHPDCGAHSLKTLADYGATKNIVVNLENDDPKNEDAFRIVKTIEQVNSPFLRALPDFCNSMLIGDEAYNYRAVEAMFQHAWNISHVKDVEVDNGKIFRVDVGRTFAIAKRAGYKGYYSMEFEGSGDPYAGTQALLAASLENLAS
jgi:sugar phosphate isomerase/epimerase